MGTISIIKAPDTPLLAQLYGLELLETSNDAEARSHLGLGSIATANAEDFTASITFASHVSDTGNGNHIPVGGITDAHVATDAAIGWSKVSKSGAVAGDVGAVVAVTANAKLWIGSQTDYNAIAVKDSTTLYVIV